jgi:hypothetical protein
MKDSTTVITSFVVKVQHGGDPATPTILHFFSDHSAMLW